MLRRLSLGSLVLLFLVTGCSVTAGKTGSTQSMTDLPTISLPATPTPLSTPETGLTHHVTPTAPQRVDVYEPRAQLGRGVNLGNALEAPNEGEWGMTLQAEYFQLIKEAGFNSVRIPIRWSSHADSAPPYTIDPAFFARVDWAVDQALSSGLVAVINMHHYDELFADLPGNQARFIALWEQIAAHYQGYGEHLIFEILNEPHDQLNFSTWNQLLLATLKVIRSTNPQRDVIVGGADYNSISMLDSLQLPAGDHHLIPTFHYYLPFHFTHQGAEWVSGSDAWLGTTWQGTPAEEGAVAQDLDYAVSWAIEHQRPLYMGEFGAYSKADMDSRARWTSYVARQAEARGISWAYWEFGAGFGVYDREVQDWNQPILQALIP
jgi:endoglucanase